MPEPRSAWTSPTARLRNRPPKHSVTCCLLRFTAMARIYILALLAIGVMAMAASFVAAPARDAAVPLAAAQPAEPAGETDALMLKRDGSGQFRIAATVNNVEVTFLVDTGADLIALTEAEAQNVGLNVPESEFKPVMQTASGIGYGAMVHIDTIEVAGTTLRDVEAVVVRDLSVNLLGQTALRQMGGIELNRDTMVIRPR